MPRTSGVPAKWRAFFAEDGTVALLSLISPCAEERRKLREVHADTGMTFFEVYVNTPLEVCEERDPKGLYAKAAAGDLPDFTGVGAEYEVPKYPDLELTPECGEIFDQALRVVGLLSAVNQS